MSSSSAAPPAWMWCHECQMEIQPLRIPELACPRCRGSFIEELDGTEEHVDDDGEEEEEDGEDARAWPFLGNQPPQQRRQEEQQAGAGIGAGIGAGAAHWLSALFGGAAAGGQQQPMQRVQASGSMPAFGGGWELNWNVQRGEGEMPLTLSE